MRIGPKSTRRRRTRPFLYADRFRVGRLGGLFQESEVRPFRENGRRHGTLVCQDESNPPVHTKSLSPKHEATYKQDRPHLILGVFSCPSVLVLDPKRTIVVEDFTHRKGEL